jgi:tetratricopeptide (TPR) repeat protein
MDYQIACSCGIVLSVYEGMAGSSIACSCGRTVPVPSLSELRGEAIMDVLPVPAPDLKAAVEPVPRPEPMTEIIAPMEVALRIEERWPGANLDPPSRRAKVMAALTADTLWLQDTWQLRAVPLRTVASIEGRRRGRVLTLTFNPEASTERLTLTFASSAEGRRWRGQLEKCSVGETHTLLDSTRSERRPLEGVALVRRAPDVPHEVVGRVMFMDQSLWMAERGIQLRAGMRGANAIIDVHSERCADLGWGARHISGIAVRVEDAEARKRLRLRWYAERVNSLVNRALLLLLIQAAMLFLLGVFCVGLTSLYAATGETLPQALASTGKGLALVYVWPLILLVLLRVLRWPQFLRPAGIALLAATTLRGLALMLAHLAAAQDTGARLTGIQLLVLVDPVDWAFIIIGWLLCRRAWRLAGDASQILPPEVQVASTTRRAWAGGSLALTGVYALVLLGLVGTVCYQESCFLLQPGVDPKREQQALLALNEGSDLANRGELEAADRSLQRALRLWEELTAKRPVPVVYRANLAATLNDLGWVRQKQGRLDEAEKYFARAVAIADALGDDPQLDDDFKQSIEGARNTLVALRNGKPDADLENKDQVADLENKDQLARRKYEEAQVKAAKGEAEAERLFREAIALWQEILPHASADYRKGTIAQIALTYLHISELQQQQDKRSEAEASLKKAVEFGKQAVDLDPDRPLAKHNLEVARNRLDRLHDEAFLDQIRKLCEKERLAEVVEVFERSIEEQQKQARADKDREVAERRLAYRLDRFAWFLAHCPAGGIRDTKEAVKRARLATELQPDVADYWYTLAMVQYRNGDWLDSLASLDKVKAGQNEFDASSWLLTAMNRHQLKQRAPARAAMQKAVEWIEDRQNKAKDDRLLQFQFEMMRPEIESLRREAEDLIEGKDPANKGIG